MTDEIKAIKLKYRKGTRVRLLKMDDLNAPPIGTKGTVYIVDDVGTIHVNWDNGSHLGVALGEDECEIVEERESRCMNES